MTHSLHLHPQIFFDIWQPPVIFFLQYPSESIDKSGAAIQ